MNKDKNITITPEQFSALEKSVPGLKPAYDNIMSLGNVVPEQDSNLDELKEVIYCAPEKINNYPFNVELVKIAIINSNDAYATDEWWESEEILDFVAKSVKEYDLYLEYFSTKNAVKFIQHDVAILEAVYFRDLPPSLRVEICKPEIMELIIKNCNNFSVEWHVTVVNQVIKYIIEYDGKGERLLEVMHSDGLRIGELLIHNPLRSVLPEKVQTYLAIRSTKSYNET